MFLVSIKWNHGAGDENMTNEPCSIGRRGLQISTRFEFS